MGAALPLLPSAITEKSVLTAVVTDHCNTVERLTHNPVCESLFIGLDLRRCLGGHY